jgi:hypothetical protein
MDWGGDDVRIIGDAALGFLLGYCLRVMLVKVVIEPVMIFYGQRIYRRADDAVGGRLPDFLRGDAPPHSTHEP